jgi:hypothetical protein
MHAKVAGARKRGANVPPHGFAVYGAIGWRLKMFSPEVKSGSIDFENSDDALNIEMRV